MDLSTTSYSSKPMLCVFKLNDVVVLAHPSGKEHEKWHFRRRIGRTPFLSNPLSKAF